MVQFVFKGDDIVSLMLIGLAAMCFRVGTDTAGLFLLFIGCIMLIGKPTKAVKRIVKRKVYNHPTKKETPYKAIVERETMFADYIYNEMMMGN